MLFGWRSPGHMQKGLGRKVLAEAQKFYHDYLDAMYGTPDDDDEDDDDDWNAETIRGKPV